MAMPIETRADPGTRRGSLTTSMPLRPRGLDDSHIVGLVQPHGKSDVVCARKVTKYWTRSPEVGSLGAHDCSS